MRGIAILFPLLALAIPSFSTMAAPTPAGDISITKNGKKGTHDCKGGTATISGNANTMTFKNCKKVMVAGNKNKITLEACSAVEVAGNKNTAKAGQVKSISAMGNDNSVTYKIGPKKEKPSISNLGSRNKIRPE